MFNYHKFNIGNILGGELGQFEGEVELFGGEASPAPPPLDETLTGIHKVRHNRFKSLP